MSAMGIVGIVVLVFLAFFLVRGIRIVHQAEVIIIERLGRFHTILQPGFHIIIPVVDNVRPFRLHSQYRSIIDLREQVMDFPPQPVITNDNVTMMVDSVVYFQIADPMKAMYEISDVTLAIRQLAMTNLRNIMGELQLDETLTSRETVNAKLRTALDDATDKWGVKVTRVEIKNINPPQEIEDAMAKQMKAERERRAVVTEAEGVKTAQVLRAEGERDAAIAAAEGEKRSRVLNAEGEAEAILRVAQAEARKIDLIYTAIHTGRPTADLISIKYLETLEKMANGKSTKMFIPYDASSVLSAVGMIKDVMDKGGKLGV